jgi:hypothetical protein
VKGIAFTLRGSFRIGAALAFAALLSSGCGGGSADAVPQATTMPGEVQLVGLSVAEAKDRLARAGWKPERSHEDATGRYVNPDPQAEYSLNPIAPDPSWPICIQKRFTRPDGSVYLVLFSDPVCVEIVTVPDIVGKNWIQAGALAEDVGLLLDEEPKADVGAEWIVCEQSPVGGTEINRVAEPLLWAAMAPPGRC